MNINPLSDLIIVQPDEPESVSAGGIILAPSSQEEAKQGTAIAVGPGKLHDGWTEPMTVKVGDRIAYSKYAKEHFRHNGRELLILHEADVIGILE